MPSQKKILLNKIGRPPQPVKSSAIMIEYTAPLTAASIPFQYPTNLRLKPLSNIQLFTYDWR